VRVRDTVVDAIGRIGPAAMPTLAEALRHDDPTLRAGVTEALGVMGPAAQEAVPLLNSLLRDRIPHIAKVDAPAALYRITGDTKMLAALLEALGHHSERVRSGAVDLLGKIGPVVVPDLILALQSGDPDVREGAADALGMIGPAAKEAVPALDKAFEDEAWYVRECAAEALMKIQRASEDAP
jgi:HEAT repeat protein